MMGVSIFYNGKLAEGKTVDELVSYLEALAKDKKYRTEKVDEIFKFKIPQTFIDNPDSILWYYTNKVRIRMNAKDARVPIKGKSHEKLCEELNATEFRQVGIYVWAHKEAEPLRFLFVEGDNELTELYTDYLGKGKERLQYVRFQRESLATKTGYEHDPAAHRAALAILNEVNKLFFNGKMFIKDPE